MGTHPIFESDFDCLTDGDIGMVNSDDDWEDDDFEQCALEIQGYSNSSEETLVFDMVSKMKIIGIDTPNPIMQIDGHIFKGQYENMIGSCLFLNGDVEKVQGGADIFDSITEKKLVMSRCLLSKKTEKDETFFTGNTHQEEEEDEDESSDEDYEIDLVDELKEAINISSDSESEMPEFK